MGEENKLADKAWYIVTTYAGHEQKVKANLELRVQSLNLEYYVFRIIVAEEKEKVCDEYGQPIMKKDRKTGKEEFKYRIKNLYPGYVFVEMIMTDDSWFMVRNTLGVTGIAGSSGGGQKPTPVDPKEIENILMKMGVMDEDMYSKYNVGDIVKINAGMFKDTEGKISSINREKGIVNIQILFFGKLTEVELEFKDIIHI